MQPELVSIAEAQHMVSVGRSSIYALIKAERLDRVHLGRRSLITVASIRTVACVPTSALAGSTDLTGGR